MARSRIRSRLIPLVLAGCLAVAACGDDDAGSSEVTVPHEETGSTPTSSRETTSTTEDPTAAVEAAFYAQWDAFVEILENPDVANPMIDDFFTGRAHESLVDVVSEYLAEGKAAARPEDPEDFEPRIVEIIMQSSTRAHVYECTVDGALVIDVETGEILDDNVGTYEAKNTFELVDGRWKLENSVDEVNEGEPSCDDL